MYVYMYIYICIYTYIHLFHHHVTNNKFPQTQTVPNIPSHGNSSQKTAPDHWLLLASDDLTVVSARRACIFPA